MQQHATGQRHLALAGDRPVELAQSLQGQDAVAVHGFCGIWGTWAVGLFATGDFADFKGLFYGGGTKQLWAQVWGNGLVVIVTLVVSFAMFYGVKATRTLRVSEEGELEGIDVHEHGSPAYHPEAAYMGKGL